MQGVQQGKTVRHRTDETDRLIGERLRMRRLLLRLTQQNVADRLGLTFQQIQKYEKGLNCISVGRLCQLAKILKVPVIYFLEDALKDDTPLTAHTGRNARIKGREDPMTKPETIKLVHNYYKIQNRKIAQQIFDLLDKIANPRKQRVSKKKDYSSSV